MIYQKESPHVTFKKLRILINEYNFSLALCFFVDIYCIQKFRPFRKPHY